jgi:ABC-type transporter Mla MlaB component
MRASVKTSKRKRVSAVEPVPEIAMAAVPETSAAVQVQTAPAAPVVLLPSICTVKDAAALKEALCKVVNEAAAVTLDVRSVERIDTSALQLLYAFARDRKTGGLEFTWLGVSASLLEAARLLNIHASLGLPENETVGAEA